MLTESIVIRSSCWLPTTNSVANAIGRRSINKDLLHGWGKNMCVGTQGCEDVLQCTGRVWWCEYGSVMVGSDFESEEGQDDEQPLLKPAPDMPAVIWAANFSTTGQTAIWEQRDSLASNQQTQLLLLSKNEDVELSPPPITSSSAGYKGSRAKVRCKTAHTETTPGLLLLEWSSKHKLSVDHNSLLIHSLCVLWTL